MGRGMSGVFIVHTLCDFEAMPSLGLMYYAAVIVLA